MGAILFTTATPGPYELGVSPPPVPQVVRPTGLLDPPVQVRPLAGQIDDLMEEVRAHAARHERVLVTTLTKRTAEDLAQYFREAGLRVEHLHSDVDAIERVDILLRLRKGDFDALVGVNLLREGLDLPEVALVAILDADKEGFLRSESALIQVAGRAARHLSGKVILYADQITESMRRMLRITEERRKRQLDYNRRHGITPRGIQKAIGGRLAAMKEAEEIEHRVVRDAGVQYDVHLAINELEKEMLEAAAALEFERAAMLRDEMKELLRQTGTADRSRQGGGQPVRTGRAGGSRPRRSRRG